MTRVTFGVPAYRAEKFIGETIDSILAQEAHQDFRILIAVDSQDDATADICRAYGDSRIEVVEHANNKGWLNNINWLYERCETEFFNYVAHDDVLHPAYLRVLLEIADRKPEAVAIYAILRWFGSMDTEVRHEIKGNRFERQKCQVKNRFWAPFLGLIRQPWLRQAAPLRTSPFDNAFEDAAFTSRLALHGELEMAPYDLYGKRAHPGAVSRRFAAWDDSKKCAAWKNVMGRLLETALPTAETRAERTELYLLAARSVALPNPLSWTFFRMDKLSAEDKLALAGEFLDEFTQARGLDLEQEIDMSLIPKLGFV